MEQQILECKQLVYVGYIGVKYCDKLFKIEEKIAKFDVDEKRRQREEESKPVLEEFYEWINDTLTNKVIVNKKLLKALNYANNQRKELSIFIEDGRIPLTNNLAERTIRPFAVHRKNWLFADSVAGAKANAVMYSLIESAKINNLNIYKYMRYLLEELPQLEVPISIDTLRKYLPWSNELPEEVRNFEGKYEELKVE